MRRVAEAADTHRTDAACRLDQDQCSRAAGTDDPSNLISSAPEAQRITERAMP